MSESAVFIEIFEDDVVIGTEVESAGLLELTLEDEVTVVELDPQEFLEFYDGQGPFTSGGGGGYVHNQTTPSASWTVTHGLNTIREPVVVLDSDPTEIAHTSVEVINLNTLSLTFDSAVTGKAYL